MHRTRKAIGEIMAAMILLLIASIAGVLLFTTSLKASNEQGALLRDQYKSEGDSAQERLELLNAEYNDDDTISAWIYNYGNLDCEIIAIYVDQTPVISQNPEPSIIKTGEITKITLTPETIPVSSYKITCISERGVKIESTWTK